MSKPFVVDISMSAMGRIRDLLTPVNDDEAVRKDYVDGLTVGTLYSGTGASGIVDFGTITVPTGTAPEEWLVDWMGYNPANQSQAGIMFMRGFVSRGSGSPVVGQVTNVAESMSGSPSMFMSFSGSNVFVRVNLSTQTNVSWKARVIRKPYASF